MWWDSFNFIVIEKQYSLTRVQVQCIYFAYEWYVKAKVWSINSNKFQLHFNTDVTLTNINYDTIFTTTLWQRGWKTKSILTDVQAG